MTTQLQSSIHRRANRCACTLARAVLFACVLGTAFALPRPKAARAEVEVSIGLFHEQLAPYGRWVDSTYYGRVWCPSSVSVGWRPYTEGHWVWTDDGWYFESDKPWGWATFHYGRWYYDPTYGWAWVPGTVWAPAWVEWRSGDDYVGWAPLTPDLSYDDGVGFHAYVSLGEPWWVFVPKREFLAPRVREVIVYDAGHRRHAFAYTRDSTRYESIGHGHARNWGIRADDIERATHRHVERVRIAPRRPLYAPRDREPFEPQVPANSHGGHSVYVFPSSHARDRSPDRSEWERDRGSFGHERSDSAWFRNAPRVAERRDRQPSRQFEARHGDGSRPTDRDPHTLRDVERTRQMSRAAEHGSQPSRDRAWSRAQSGRSQAGHEQSQPHTTRARPAQSHAHRRH